MPLRTFSALCLGLALTSGILRAQSTVHEEGMVADSTGAAIAGATVTLSTQEKAVATTHSDSAGRFSLDAPAASYLLTVAAKGFAPQTIPISPHRAPAEPLAITLTVATNSEQVDVEAEATGILQPAETQLGSVLDRKQLAAVPVNGRSLTDLLALTPGVVPTSSAQPNAVVMSGVASTPPSGTLDVGALSVSGQRETSNSFRVNGSDVQEDVNMGIAIVPSLDSVADLTVLTGSFDARLGNQSGGQVAVTTRSGTAHLHGSAYDYFRNTALDARSYFSSARAAFHQNQFGGTLGGHLPHAPSLFFFADYQGTRQTQGIDTGLISVPSVADRSGNLADQAQSLSGAVSGADFAQLLSARLGYPVTQGEPYLQVFPGGVIPASAFSGPARNLLQYIPLPNRSAATFSTSAYAETVRDDKGAFRVDRQTRFGALSAYTFLDDYAVLNPYPAAQGGATVPGFHAENRGRTQLDTVNLLTTFGGIATNQAHVSWMRNAADVGQPRGGTGIPLASQGFVTGANSAGILPQLPGIEGVENVNFNSFTLGVDVTGLFQAENLFELSDDLTRTLGHHTVSAGATFHADQIDTHPDVYDNGSFSFTGSETGSDFADFLLGIDSSYTQGDGQNFYNRNHYVGVYAQDGWQIRPALTLNAGLRYDILPPWSEKYNQLLSLDPTPGVKQQSVVFPNAPAGILFPGDPGVPRTLSPTRYNDFAPRLALSWALPASPLTGAGGATLLKAGYALYYSAFEGLSAGIVSGNPPYGLTYTTPSPTLFEQPFLTAATGVSLGQRFPLQKVAFGASAAHPNTSVDWSNFEPLTGIPAFARNNVTPYAENYTLSLERQLARQTVLHLSYVGTQAHHLLVLEEVNPGNPAACLALSTPSQVAPNSATCGPFGESGAYTAANGTPVQGTRTGFSPAFGGLTLQQTIANSHDNAFEASVGHSGRALFLQIGYTWSKSIDQSSSLAEAVYPVSPISPSGAALSRALSAFDLTQNFVATYSYSLPVERLLAAHPQLTRGWQISGLTRLSTGFPVTLVDNNDTSLLGTQPNGINNNGIDEPQFSPGSLHLASHPSAASSFAFDTGRFSLPALGTLGNARRRFFYGPGADNTDLTLKKSTPLPRETRLELELQAFNVFNHAQFFGPAAIDGNVSSGAFGHFQNAAPPRLLQLAARLAF